MRASVSAPPSSVSSGNSGRTFSSSLKPVPDSKKPLRKRKRRGTSSSVPTSETVGLPGMQGSILPFSLLYPVASSDFLCSSGTQTGGATAKSVSDSKQPSRKRKGRGTYSVSTSEVADFPGM